MTRCALVLLFAVLVVISESRPNNAYGQTKESAKSGNATKLVLCSDGIEIRVREKCKFSETRLNIASLKKTIAFEAIPSGTTVYGHTYVGHSIVSGIHFISFDEDLNGHASSIIGSDNVVLKLNSVVTSACSNLSDCIGSATLVTALGKTGQCTGTYAFPTAPAGLVCVYPGIFDNINTFTLFAETEFSFAGFWSINAAVNLGASTFSANWAYTAP